MGRVRHYNRKITIENAGVQVSTWSIKTIRGDLWLVVGTVKGNQFAWPTNDDECPAFMTREPTLDEMQAFLDYLCPKSEDAEYPKSPSDCDLV